MFRVPLSWENLRPSACRNILFILTSVVTLVRGGCLAAGAIFSAWGWEHLLARQLAPPFTPKASKWMLLGSWFYWGLCWVFCLVHVSMWCCFGSSISKHKKTPAHPLCLCTHGSGKFKYNFQQSGGGESDDDDDECQVRRAVRTEYVLLLFVRAQICADCFGNVVQSQAVQLSRLRELSFRVEMSEAMTTTAPEAPQRVQRGSDVPTACRRGWSNRRRGVRGPPRMLRDSSSSKGGKSTNVQSLLSEASDDPHHTKNRQNRCGKISSTKFHKIVSFY